MKPSTVPIEMPDVDLRVLISCDAGRWLAQCVDYDIVAVASSLDDLRYEFERMLYVHVAACEMNGNVPFMSLPPGPADVVRAWESGAKLLYDLPRFKTEKPTSRQVPTGRDTRVAMYA